MAKPRQIDFEDLKSALRGLKPTGPNGFEGFLAVILTTIVGHPFRLAGSGSQHGKDGQSFFSETNLTFEAKLYKKDIPKNELFSKIMELAASASPPDLWAVGATVELKTQISDQLRVMAEQSGICMVELDWAASSPIPPLALASAMAESEATTFLNKHVGNRALVADASRTLSAIKLHPEFQSQADKLRASFTSPTLGYSLALDQNRAWLTAAFSDRKRARLCFGQALAPLAKMELEPLVRTSLLTAIEEQIFKRSEGRIAVITGGEGTGKSWLFAQAWLASDRRPITLVVSASDLKNDIESGSVLDFLIRELVRQTDDQHLDTTAKRWRKILARWAEAQTPTEPRLIVYVDGLNQRPDFVWPRWIDGLAEALETLGGKLAISTRPAHFRTRLKDTLLSHVDEIKVAEWSEAELTEALLQKNIPIKEISAPVVSTLRNPRVLGIAFELLGSNRIRGFEELSVERLLFEHIKSGSVEGEVQEPASKFMKRLSLHADEIMDRVRSKQDEDLLVFENSDFANAKRYELSSDLLAVSEGNFYKLLPDDPSLYALTDDGLTLALGLSLIRALQHCERNDRHVAEGLELLLEPIGALDKTAEAVFAALMVSSVDDHISDRVRSAIISAYLRLQNIDGYSYPAFESVVTKAPRAAMIALYSLSTSDLYIEHMDWLLSALHEARRRPEHWATMSEYLKDWLRRYTLDPTLTLFNTHGKSADEIETLRQRRITELDQRLSDLSSGEKAMLEEHLSRTDVGATPDLSKNIFALLAGMPLAGFAPHLVAWSFGQQLNSTFNAPYNEFMFLVRFNTSDWTETRQALLEHSQFLRSAETSRTGKWTLVHLLRSTATEEDAGIAESLVDELTAHREKLLGWRLVEKWCETDPCDPSSKKPRNIQNTAEEYAQIDIKMIRSSRCRGAEDLFFEGARPGLARFEPETAKRVARAVIKDQIKDREDLPFYELVALREMAAVIPAEMVPEFLEICKQKSGPYERTDRVSRDRWLLAQYALLIALSHLSGDEQLEAVLSLPEFGPPLLDLADVITPNSPELLERALERAVQGKDSNLQLTVLMFAAHPESQLTDRALKWIWSLVNSGKSSVRAQAMRIIDQIEDQVLVERFARSNWSAADLSEQEHYFERWYGGRLVARAQRRGMIDISIALDRIAPEHHWFLAGSTDESDLEAVARRVDSSISKILELDLVHAPPPMEQNIGETQSKSAPPLLSLSEDQKEIGLKEFLARMNESDEAFDARQERGWVSFSAFESTISKEQARLIIEHTSVRVIEDCMVWQPDMVANWAQTFVSLSDQKARRIYNFALLVARVISYHQPTLAVCLFERLEPIRPFVRTVFGRASIPLEAHSIWRSADVPELESLRKKRLDRAETDEVLAIETLAAMQAQKETILNQYVEDRLARPEPVFVARGLTVLGFGKDTLLAERKITDFAEKPGLIGDAAKSALYSYQRNVWAQHWFTKMAEATAGEEFWRFTSLFIKVVDARFDYWSSGFDLSAEPIRKFLPSIENKIGHRIKKWQNKRRKTLFGQEAPGPFFIVNV